MEEPKVGEITEYSSCQVSEFRAVKLEGYIVIHVFFLGAMELVCGRYWENVEELLICYVRIQNVSMLNFKKKEEKKKRGVGRPFKRVNLKCSCRNWYKTLYLAHIFFFAFALDT